MGGFASHEFPMRMEDSRNRMSKRLIVFAALTLLLTAAAVASVRAEKPDSATPTDLACAHEHRKTTIYFFDSPAYKPVSPDDHRVSGPAVVETACMDCGEILSSESVNDAEEIRPHSMKNNVCVLCGYQETIRTEERRQEKRGGEQTIIAQEDGSVSGLLTITLPEAELSALQDAGVSTALIRGSKGSAAIALSVGDILAKVKTSGADLYMELAEQEDGSFFAGLYLVSGSGKQAKLDGGGITLRIYQKRKTGNRVSVAPADSDSLMEADGMWDERGFWSVPYLEEGTYFILQ